MVKEKPEVVENGNLGSRLDCIPILHVRGTHYSVGLSIGRMFKSMIQEMLDSWAYFNEVLWKSYLDEDGKATFDKSLAHCRSKFPQYVDEIKGMADGSGVLFEKLFLLNIDSIMNEDEDTHGHGETGCTSIICNKEEVILGHTEDAMCEILNNVYIISALIVDENGGKLEKFTTFSYAGHLMGYTMGYNEHGMVYSVNTLFPSVHKLGTPRAFIARAILGSDNLQNLLDTLRDSGAGISDGMSINVHFANEESSRTFYNIEVLPPSSEDKKESLINTLTVNSGESLVHCNKYLRFKAVENPVAVAISSSRQETIEKHPNFFELNLSVMKNILSDQSNDSFPVYICDESIKTNKVPHIKTVAVGLFNLLEKTWTIYLGKPEDEPVAVLPLIFNH